MTLANEEPIFAAALSVDISPRERVQLGAAADVDHLPWQGVADGIEANLLLLRESDGAHPILLVSLDLLYPGGRVRDAIVDSSGMPEECVIVAASHTHRAPMTDDTKPGLGMPDPRYMGPVLDAIRDTVKRLLTLPLEPCTATANTVRATHSINRRLRKLLVVSRRPRINEVVNAPNPRGTTDESLTTISLRRSDGSPLAVIWNYACHPVAAPRIHAVSAHFPGSVRTRLRDNTRAPALPVLFLQGFSGDTRPAASAHVHSPSRRLRQLVSGPLFEHMTPRSYAAWCTSLADVVETCRSGERVVGSTGISARRAELPGSEFYTPAIRPVSFACVRIGPSIVLIGLSGEVVSAYAKVVRAALTQPYVCCVGCIDHTYGYVPTGAMTVEGGYEAGGFRRTFAIDIVLKDVEDAVFAGLALVAPEAEFVRYRESVR